MSFTFKKIGTLSVIATALFAASWGASAATDSSSATIEISVTVVAKTCTPGWAGKDTNVSFGLISLKDLGTTKDQVAAKRDFTLSLTDCDSSVAKVKVTATGTADANDSTAFANTGTAKGVGVKLRDADTDGVIANGQSAEFNVTDQVAEMKFSAELVNTGAALSEGDLKSTVTLNMEYE